MVHMANTISAVDWAVGRGANGVEIDIDFNSSTGDLRRIHHGPPCDCTCKCPPPFYSLCGLNTNQVCAPLYYDVKADPCEAESPVPDMFNHLASKKEVALIYLDSKIKSMTKETMTNAGRNVVEAVNSYLFGANYGGRVIIGTLRFSALPYLESVIKEAQNSKYRDRMYFTVENEENGIVEVLKTLHALPTANIVYGTGSSSCNPIWPIKDATLELASINTARGVTGISYFWTVDNVSRMKEGIKYLQGIMTNYPGVLYDMLIENGIELATQSSTIPVTTSSDVITNTSMYNCSCEYSRGGCVITLAAPKGMSCQCAEKIGWRCEGSVVQCHDTIDSHCSSPDTSVYSCLLGRGNCNGYDTAKCECKFTSGGCSVVQAPPANTSCKCIRKTPWNCIGQVTRCKDKDSMFCRKPDTSLMTCIQGGGDCNSYKKSDCKCDFGLGGCYISQASPTGTACKCTNIANLVCRGELIDCVNSSSKYCKSPDTSFHSCFQGNGNCEGYKSASCDCTFQSGGCVIISKPPPNAACRCDYKGFWTCRGNIVRCRAPAEHVCRNPDFSKSTCLYGGGNCGGYP